MSAAAFQEVIRWSGTLAGMVGHMRALAAAASTAAAGAKLVRDRRRLEVEATTWTAAADLVERTNLLELDELRAFVQRVAEPPEEDLGRTLQVRIDEWTDVAEALLEGAS